MINEANSILPHHRAADVLAREWRKINLKSYREVELANGRIADVLAGTNVNDLYIAEVKTDLKASLIEEALAKYGRWCNYLYMAVPGLTEAMMLRQAPLDGFPQPWHRVGVIGIYPDAIRTLRPPSYRQVGDFDRRDTLARIRAAADRKDR